MKLNNPLVILDLEATGTWVDKDKIIEVAIVKILPTGEKEIYHQRINPGIPIPAEVIELIGITDNDVKDEPLFKDVAEGILQFIGDADLAGFSAERFDLPLLEREMNEAGKKFEWQMRKTYDAQRVYHLNEKRDLTAAYKYYCQKEMQNAHTALADVQATWEILCAQVAQYCPGDDRIESLNVFAYKRTEAFYDDERKFRWWNGKLYMMFGKYARKNSLQEIVKKDRAYLEWVASANFSEDVKELVNGALSGKFPAPPSSASSKGDQLELF
ncbi:MAG: 3'-5' exonuclease [Candidatus Omnitrophota bacterium]|nr:3'-5' exonuclease [Candidatus Omnitrophota bacterium]